MSMNMIAFGWVRTEDEPGESWCGRLVEPETRVQFCHICGVRLATYLVSLVVPNGEPTYSEPNCIECVLLASQQADWCAVQ